MEQNYVTVTLFISRYYCTVYSVIQPLKAASVLSEISCQLNCRLLNITEYYAVY